MGIKNIDLLKPEGEDEPEKSDEQKRAEELYPNHHPKTALANYRAGYEVWDTNGDVW